MHESGALTWREVVESHHSALVDELSGRIDSALRYAVSEAVAAEHSQASAHLKRACDDARRSQVESLNQILRRLRETGADRILELLVDGCSSHADQAVVLVFESNQARSAGGFGLPPAETENGAISFDTGSARAVIAAIDTRDPVVALATEAEISPVLAEAFGRLKDGKAYLFPVIARHSVVAMLIASGVSVPAPIELLCEAAGMRLETMGVQLMRPASASPGPQNVLVHLGPGVVASETSGLRSWDDLTLEDQKLHLQAQRMARVRVAEMRLYHEKELRSGVAAGNIYETLQGEIDAARDQFLQTFLSKSSTMVDYLHLEILRSLAHDDDLLLGQSYPGPMV
jgi:hypothetical protein